MKNIGNQLAEIQNEHLRVTYLTQGGPRMLGLYLVGSNKNFLAETPDIKFDTPFGEVVN